MVESPLEDYLPVLKITETQPECQKTETDANIWHSLPDHDKMDTVKPTLLEFLQLSDGTDKEGLLTASKLVTEIPKAPYCGEVSSAVSDTGLVYTYDRNGVLIIQA